MEYFIQLNQTSSATKLLWLMHCHVADEVWLSQMKYLFLKRFLLRSVEYQKWFHILIMIPESTGTQYFLLDIVIVSLKHYNEIKNW